MTISTLAEDGFALSDRIEGRALAEIAILFDGLAPDRPGRRIDPRSVAVLAAIENVRAIAAQLIGPKARVVRALLFDKHDGSNWTLGWHQDRTIEVAHRVEVRGFGPFTRKQGRLHVAPPITLTRRMLTVRIHVDAVDDENGPLIVAPGSHRLGFLAEDAIDDVVMACGEAACQADVGSVWFYSTPILHRSARAEAGRRRRVLQIDLAADALPGGLCWAVDLEASNGLEATPPLA